MVENARAIMSPEGRSSVVVTYSGKAPPVQRFEGASQVEGCMTRPS